MALVIPQAILYLPAGAVFITFAGGMMNREPLRVLVPLLIGLIAASVMAVANLAWLFLPVLGIWLAGMGLMIHRNRRSAR